MDPAAVRTHPGWAATRADNGPTCSSLARAPAELERGREGADSAVEVVTRRNRSRVLDCFGSSVRRASTSSSAVRDCDASLIAEVHPAVRARLRHVETK